LEKKGWRHFSNSNIVRGPPDITSDKSMPLTIFNLLKLKR
jgi:hypothetical protein